MKEKNLNAKKIFIASSLLSGIAVFVFSINQGFGLLWAFFASVTLAIPTGWCVGMAFAIVYELLKMCKPILDWFYK